MASVNLDKLQKSIRGHEGYRRFPYLDTVGKLTVGIGRNLADVGLSDDEIQLMFENDIARVLDFFSKLDWFNNLDEVRQRVILEMGFQLGNVGVLRFQTMIAALRLNDWKNAAAAMLDSKWHTQTPARCESLAMRMASGLDPE